jgi:hypothetical protein
MEFRCHLKTGGLSLQSANAQEDLLERGWHSHNEVLWQRTTTVAGRDFSFLIDL